MGDHQHHHGHHANHDMMDNSTVSASTVATTLIQTMVTTMLNPANHHKHEMPADSASFVPGENSHTVDHSNHVSGNADLGDHMMMYFHSGVNAIILFKDWSVSSSSGMIGSVFGIFLMAVLYEGIKFFREYMFKRYFTSLEYSSVSVLGDDGKTVTEVHKVVRNRMFSWPHLIQTFLHIIQMVLSYFLMLIFMTYNIWLCLGVVLGAGTGYFLFGWKKATVVDITEHCH